MLHRSGDSSACSSSGNYHRKSSSLDAGSGNEGGGGGSRKSNKSLVPPVRERWDSHLKFIVMPSSSSGLKLWETCETQHWDRLTTACVLFMI